jgi:hypothetical protein
MNPLGPQLEKDIEKKIGTYAKSKDCLYMKFTSPSQRAVPDRLIITKGGVIGFLEVKAKGKKPTPLQMIEMKKLCDNGCHVGWCDNVDEGKAFINTLLLVGQIGARKDFC